MKPALSISDILGHIGPLLDLAGDPLRFTDRVLALVMSRTAARCAAALVFGDGELQRCVSRHFDPAAVATATLGWSIGRSTLSAHKPVYVGDRGVDRRIPSEFQSCSPVSFALFPVHRGGEPEGILYLDSLQPHFLGPDDLHEVPGFAGLLAGPLRMLHATGPRERARGEFGSHQVIAFPRPA